MPRYYVDNAQNRALGRVGMEHGTAVHSRSSSTRMSSSARSSAPSRSSHEAAAPAPRAAPVRTYVDNAQNRALGRVGLEHGTSVHRRGSPSTTSRSRSTTSATTSGAAPTAAPGGRVYADNAQNRALGRVGLPHGTAVHRRSGSSTRSASSAASGAPVAAAPPAAVRTYVDNKLNRKYGRVGKPIGSHVVSRSGAVTIDRSVVSGGAGGAGGTGRSGAPEAPTAGVAGLRYTKAGKVDMRFAASRKAVASGLVPPPSSRYAYLVEEAPKAVPTTEDGVPDMKFKAARDWATRASLAAETGSNRIPEGIKVTKNGLPDMRFKKAREWVASRARESDAVPAWVPKNKDGTLLDCAVSRMFMKNRIKPSPVAELEADPEGARESYYADMMEEPAFRDQVAHALAMPDEEPYIEPPLVELPEQDEASDLSDDVIDAGEGSDSSSSDDEEEPPRWWSKVAKCITLLRADELEINDERELGRGAFGVVTVGKYKGVDVAIKKLHLADVGDKEREEFVRELNVMSKVSTHEDIVSVIGYCVEPMAIVMELMPKGSLYYQMHAPRREDESRLTDEARMQLSSTKRRIAFHVAAAMKQLALANIAHGDLKPENVLLDEEFRPKLCDFGLAYMRAETSANIASSTITDDSDAAASGGIVGTYAYMAPEMLYAGVTACEKTDVYSYGILLNELATEVKPYKKSLRKFAGKGPLAVVSYAATGKRPKTAKKVSPSLKALIKRCWHVDPEQRPTFAEILTTFIEDTTVAFESMVKVDAEMREAVEIEKAKGTPGAPLPAIPVAKAETDDGIEKRANNSVRQESLPQSPAHGGAGTKFSTPVRSPNTPTKWVIDTHGQWSPVSMASVSPA